MASPISIQPNIKAGMCPHGVPQSSCPVCSKQNSVSMGGMNGRAAAKSSGEWSYQKCYVAGLQIKAALQRKEDADSFFEKQFQTALNLNKNIQNIYDRLNSFIQNIKTPNIQQSMQFLMNSVVNPLFNTLSQLSKFVNTVAEFRQKALDVLLQAGEKVVSIIGEIKNFVERKIVDNIKQKAKKFMLFCLSVIEDENYQNDETLLVFKTRELKKYIIKILKKQSDDEHRNNQNE